MLPSFVQPATPRRCLAVLLLCQATPLGSLVSSLHAFRRAEAAVHRVGKRGCEASAHRRTARQQTIRRLLR